MPVPEKGRLAGIDYGTVRIGVAVTDPERIIAFPHEIYIHKDEKRDAEYFRRLVAEERIVHFVVGLPLHLDGRVSEKAHEALAFGRWLSEITGLGVDYMDERYTSVLAQESIREMNLSRKKQKGKIDKIAAQLLLTAYIERGCQGTNESEFLGLED